MILKQCPNVQTPPPHPHSGLPCYANFSQLEKLTLSPTHLEMNSQLEMCGPITATAPVVVTIRLEILFYPILTPIRALWPF